MCKVYNYFITKLRMSYDNMTKKELINVCTTNKITGFNNKNKTDLIKLIQQHFNSITPITVIDTKSDNTDDGNIENAIIVAPVEEKVEIIDSKFQTKTWRAACSWYKNGKSNECELYQKRLIQNIINTKMNKTNDRFYIETNEIISKSNPMIDNDGFEYTEDFDGKIQQKTDTDDITIYFNLKFCCDAGGAQTRTLREVYHFIKCQIKYIARMNKPTTPNKKEKHTEKQKKNSSIYFINILDGDASNKNIKKFIYLLTKEKEIVKDDSVKQAIDKYIFIGSMYEFSKNNTLVELFRNPIKTEQKKI